VTVLELVIAAGDLDRALGAVALAGELRQLRRKSLGGV